jgi:hypothetical protein
MSTIKTIVARLNETAEPDREAELKKMAKTIGMPSGTKMARLSAKWSTTNNSGRNSMFKMRQKLKALGFEEVNNQGTGTPDGSYMGGAEVCVKDNWMVTLRSSFGATKHDNYYSIVLSWKR